MKIKSKKFSGMVAVLIAVVTIGGVASAQAQGEVAATNTENAANTKTSPWSATWKANFTGPTFSALDGLSGSGSNLSLKNQWRLNYALGNNWSARITPIVEYKSGNANRASSFEFADPYVGVKKTKFLEWRAAQMQFSGEARYYVPVSESTRAGVGTGKDRGNGRGFIRLLAAKDFGDSEFSFLGDFTVKREFAKAPTEDGEVMHYEIFNFIRYTVGKDLLPYVVYKNKITRNRDGSGDAWAENQQLGLGAVWKPISALSVDPSVATNFTLQETEFLLEAVYRIL